MKAVIPRVAILLVLASSACGDPLGVPRDPDPPIQTDVLEYQLTKRGLFLRTSIDYQYANPGSEPIYIQNCLGGYGIVLEQLRDGEWNVVWGNVIPACVSPAIELAPGASLAGRLAVTAGVPSCGCGGFETDEIDGIYRMVVVDAYDAVDEEGLASGDLVPLERRTSNRFVIRF